LQNICLGGVHGCYYKFLNNDIYNKNYDQILLVDCDIIVSPNAPNIFDLGKIEFAARADINEKAKHVWYQQLVEVDPYIPGIDTTYFNVGVCYMSQETYNMLYESILPYYVHDAQQQLKFGKGPTAPDQTPVNQKIHKAGLYTELDPRWNNMVLAEGWDSNAYCWHFAGVPHEKKYEIMKDAWNILRDSY
jgi:lipopolysaccharide biosynthesis glycosyltransferase